MIIKVVEFFEEQKNYIENYTKETADVLWNQQVLGEKWNKLCCYSPFPLDDRKPECIKDIDLLREQIKLVEKMDVTILQNQMQMIAEKLPNYDDDPITVGIIIADAGNETVNQMQNGVAGASLFGNMLIQVNPLVKDYEEWILYVFAHEYHHTVWGNYWFNLHGDELENDLLQALLIDGQADSFARSLFPQLAPKWLYLDQQDMVEKLYEKQYMNHLQDKEFDYSFYMFGNQVDIPWCAGYAIGYYMIQRALYKNPITFRKMIETKPGDLWPDE